MPSSSSSDTPPRRSAPKQSRARRKRAQILAAARKVLSRYGLAKTTMEDIARRAGAGKATLYYHFASKEDIFRAVVEEESEILLGEVRQAMADACDAPSRLKAFVRARYTHLRKLRTLYRITQERIEELLPLAHHMRERYFELEVALIRDLLDQGVREGSFAISNLDQMALLMVSGLWGFDSVVLLRGLEDSALEGLDEMIDLLLHGLLRRDRE